ncbi:MAG: hypothetical protein WCW44_04745 [archaeon]|jgi:hypothetical protein
MGTGKKLVIGGVVAVGAIGVIGILLVILIVGYLGFMPVVSDIMGTNKPKDLGVTYSTTDLASGLAKLDGTQVLNETALCVTCKYTSTGSVPVESSYTSAEFTAHLNEISSDKGPLKDTQVKFNKDGTFEATGLISDPRFTNAFYIKGTIAEGSGKTIKLDLSDSSVGNLGLAGDQKQKAEEVLNSAVSDFINKNPGMSVESISISDGQLNYKGTMPAQITGDPNSQPEDVFSKYGAGYIN